ncbi:hypothetical protein SAMN02745116_02457 [Pilibacter termitis]|jgi:hypothetical protein|uniref:Uncharacterized protein n=1 Tax=Pilibacter termitis TaxID=263852 RepID=A0A1T4R6G1_9ENTE|nr:hypothetical protein [Pilibacter termitis]SKA11634.1 hypothetical protein SAMN02745116_02457 [Pilibacter termitis]
MERINYSEPLETQQQLTEVETPKTIDTDMVELLILVVDDLCVQVGEIKEKIAHDDI